MAVHKISILSDTHNLLREEVRNQLVGSEAILHAGDIASDKVIHSLQEIAPLHVVKGNADKNVSVPLEEQLDVSLFGFLFHLVHNKKQLSNLKDDTDFVIFGHSHKLDIYSEKKVTYMNPGSCGPRRFTQPVTMLHLFLDEESHSYEIKLCDLSRDVINSNTKDTSEVVLQEEIDLLKQQDMNVLIGKIIKDMKANRSSELIAVRNGVSIALVKQILQIYTTHPGIDVYGIMNRMDIWGK